MSSKVVLREERQPRKSGGPRVVAVCRCTIPGCSNEVRVRRGDLDRAKAICRSHSGRKRPFESIYLGLFRDHRGIPVTLTYEEYLEFTTHPNCYYCNRLIPWSEYGTVEGEYISRAYFLDRKDNFGPYSKQNCVACCTFCNWLKKDLSHNEYISACCGIADNHKRKIDLLVDQAWRP